MTVSIMLVTYNRLDLTKRTLESLYKTTDIPYRLIIVDNGSTDGTVSWLECLENNQELCQSVNIHLNEKNLGIAYGRNMGLKIADQFQDEWLSTIDNDVEMPKGWLKECVEIIQANPNYSIGVNMEDTSYPLVTKNGKTFQNKPVGNLGTACTVFNRKLHKDIGYFTMEYNTPYGTEDANFFFRARMAGYELGYLSRPGTHLGSGELDTGEYRKFKDECHQKNFQQFQKDCHDYMSRKKSFYHAFQI